VIYRSRVRESAVMTEMLALIGVPHVYAGIVLSKRPLLPIQHGPLGKDAESEWRVGLADVSDALPLAA
jgi:hypothetical protein